MKYKLLLIFFVFLSVTNYVSAITEVYDDFSGNNFDLTKWEIKPDTTGAPSQLTDIYQLDNISHNYNIAQTFPGSDKGTVLTMKRLMNKGEVLDLDIIYNSGNGNQEGKPYFNGIPLDLIMYYSGYNCGGCPTSGNIGYWNGPSEVSNTPGLHHLRIEFNNASNTKITFTKPDLTNFTYIATIINYPVEFGVGLRTGHNGVASYSFDNFIITNNTIIEKLPDLTISSANKYFCRINGKKTGVSFIAKIQNKGFGFSQNSNLLISYNNTNNTYQIPSLNFKKPYKLITQCMPIQNLGLNTAYFKIDSLNQIQESNESNNEQTLIFNVR